MEPAITVENLSKMYRIKGEKAQAYTTLRDSIATGVKGVFTGKSFKNAGGYSDFWALKDINFTIAQGDRVGIIGRNGAGKSTLLKVLSRIVTPTTGKITIDGRVGSLLEVGTGFHPELTGRENIFLNGSLLGMTKQEIKNKFDEIVDFAEVEKFLDTPVKRYSSGMYVRLAFAVAANLEPEILIVDEVLAVGDAAFQKKCLGKMEDVSTKGRTVIFVSHNMEVVQKLCNKGILLKNGQLVETGSINSVVNKYLDTYAEGNLEFEITPPNEANEINAVAKSLRVTDVNGKIIPEVVLGKDFCVDVFFTVNKKTDGLVIAIGVNSVFGQAIRTTWSVPKNLEPGNYKATFINDGIILTSGQYKLTVGISSEKRVIHYAENCGVLSISDVSDVYDDNQIINTKSGLLINQMKVEISKL